MNHQEIRRDLQSRLQVFLDSKEYASLEKQPRPYQLETLQSMLTWLADPNGTQRGYVSHATGLGKTYLFSLLLRPCAGLRTLIVVPRKLLLIQAARELVKMNGGVIGHVSGLKNIQDEDGEVIAVRGHEYQDVVITTDASLKRNGFLTIKEFAPHLVLWDECHSAYTRESQLALSEASEAIVIGFSATPDYLGTSAKQGYVPVTLENGQFLYGPRGRFADTHFETRLDRRTVRWGIENGFLAPLAWGQVGFDISLDSVPVVSDDGESDYDNTKLQKLMLEHWPLMMETIVRLYKSNEYNLSERQAFAVCPGVKHAEDLADMLNGIGIPSACVTGDTPDKQRDEILAKYKRREIRFLSSVLVLREGWDAPNAEVGMMLRPTKSRVFYEQAIGRSLRLDQNNEDKIALIIDVHFQRSTFSPLSAPMLYGKAGDEVKVGDFLIRGKRRGGSDFSTSISPYLPSHVAPRIVIVQETQIEYWAGEDGIFEYQGEKWSTISAAAKFFQLSDAAVKPRCAGLLDMKGRSKSGNANVFYRLADIEKACADLLKEMPQAGEDGTFEHQGGVWSTLIGARKHLGLDYQAMKSRCVGLASMEGKDKGGKVNTYFCLSDLARVCRDLLKEMPQAGEDGTFEYQGEAWSTISVAAQHFQLSDTAVRPRRTDLSGIEGKQRSGRICTFYRLTDIKKACADLLTGIPQAGDDGTFEYQGEVWITLRTAVQRLGLSNKALEPRCAGLSCMEGKSKIKQVCSFYRLADIEKACADLLKEMPQAGEDGTFEHQGGVWSTLMGAAKKLGLGYKAMKSRCVDLASMEGKDRGRKITTFYRLSDIKKACADMLKKKRKN